MKKIIIILIHCYLINIYNSKEDILQNKSNISIYRLNSIYHLNRKNTLNKTIILQEQTSQKTIRDLWNLSSLLLANMLDHDTKSQKNYILDSERTVPLTLEQGTSGFLADTIFLQLHKTCLPNPIKIFATGAYDYPEFDKTLDSILKQKEFINENIKESSLENNDDISINKNTLYYNPYLINKIIPELEKQFTEEKNKNIPIQFIGGIAIKLLNWLAHCHEEKTFESIVFLPKKMISICQAIHQSLKENNIIEKGDFIYIADTNEAKEYCNMIKNETLNQKISINQNIQLNKEKTLSLICLATIDHYCNIIKPLKRFCPNEESIIKSIQIENDFCDITNKIIYHDIIFNLNDINTIFMKLSDIIEADYILYGYTVKNKFINFLHNIIINGAFKDTNIFSNIIINKKYPFILLDSSPFQSSNIIHAEFHGNYITNPNKNLFITLFDTLINCKEISAEGKLCSLAQTAYYFCLNKTKTEIDDPQLIPTIDFILSYTEILLTKNTEFMNDIKNLNLKLKNNEIDKLSWAQNFFKKSRTKIAIITTEKNNTAMLKDIKQIVQQNIQLTNKNATHQLFVYYRLFKDTSEKITIAKLKKICNLIIEYDKKHKDAADTDSDRGELQETLWRICKQEEPEIINQPISWCTLI